MWWTSCWRPGRSQSGKSTQGPAQQKEPSCHSRQPTGQTAVTDASLRGSGSDVRSSGASKEEQVNPLHARPGPPIKQNSLRKAVVRQQTAGENAQPAPASGESEAPRAHSGGSATEARVATPPGTGPRSAPTQPQLQAPVSPARPVVAAAALAAAGGVRQAQASPNAAGNQRLPTLAGSSTERPGGLPTGRPSLNDIQREIERMEAQFLQGRPAPGSTGRPTSRRQLSALSNSTPSAPRSYDIQISPGQNQVSPSPQQLQAGNNPGPAPASGPAQMVSAAGAREMNKQQSQGLGS